MLQAIEDALEDEMREARASICTPALLAAAIKTAIPAGDEATQAHYLSCVFGPDVAAQFLSNALKAKAAGGSGAAGPAGAAPAAGAAGANTAQATLRASTTLTEPRSRRASSSGRTRKSAKVGRAGARGGLLLRALNLCSVLCAVCCPGVFALYACDPAAAALEEYPVDIAAASSCRAGLPSHPHTSCLLS